MSNKLAYIRTNILLLCFPYRIAILIILLILKQYGGFGPDQFTTLLCFLLPVSALYTSFFVKFLIDNRYQTQGKVLGKYYIGIGFFALLMLLFFETALIVWKGFNTTAIEDSSFLIIICSLESGFGIYAGLYITDLFGKQDRAE